MPDIYHIQSYSRTKHYGRALNRHIACLPKGCWVVVRDMDTLPLTPNWVDCLYEAIEDHPDTELFTCATNRVYKQPLDESADILYHMELAKNRPKKYTLIGGVVPAFFWFFPRTTWERVPFDKWPILWPPKRPNSFDVRWSRALGAGKKYRIEHLYMWHTYRLGSTMDYGHLR